MRDLEKDKQLFKSLAEIVDGSEAPPHTKILIKTQMMDLTTMTELAIIRIKDLDRRCDTVANYVRGLRNDGIIKWTPEIDALINQIAPLKAETDAAQ
jgi:hypothetical protein